MATGSCATTGAGLASKINVRSATSAAPSGSTTSVMMRGESENPRKPITRKDPSAPTSTRSTSVPSIMTARGCCGAAVPDTRNAPSGSNRRWVISGRITGIVGSGDAAASPSGVTTATTTGSAALIVCSCGAASPFCPARILSWIGRKMIAPATVTAITAAPPIAKVFVCTKRPFVVVVTRSFRSTVGRP